MKSTWKQFRYRLEYVGLRLLVAGIPRLPRRGCLRLADLLGNLYYRWDAKTRAVALENLRVCFGDAFDAPARARIARASFRNFARSMLDLFWAKRLTPENYTRHIRLEGFDELRQVITEAKGYILVELHHGNHEWTSLGTGFAGLPLCIVTMDFKNPALEAIFAEARSHAGHRMINRHQSMLRLLRVARRRGGVGLLIDLALSLEHPGEVIDAFGMKMHVTFLHALLHQRTGVPIIPVTNIAQPDGTCTITAHPPLTFADHASQHEIVQAVWDFFEPFIRARPDLWLWSYRHWRHKPRDATREYPDYARTSSKFERALVGERPLRRPSGNQSGAPGSV